MRPTSLTRRDLLWTTAAASALASPSLLPAQDAVTRRIESDLERHASFGSKRHATPGDLMTAEWIAQRMRSAGYKVDELDFEAPFLIERQAYLQADGMRLKLYPQLPAATTGAKGVTANLALIHNTAEAAATNGKIAFLVLNSARHAALGRGGAGIGGTIEAAAKAGAVGVVIVTTGPSGEAILLNCPEENVMPVPVAIMAPKDSEAFQEAAAKGAQATFVLDGDATHRPSKNLIGRLERGPNWIVISTPRSGWFDCVGERGTGTSVFLELAAWAVDRFPQHSIQLMNAGGHEYYFRGVA